MTGSPYISTSGPPYSIHSERIVVASLTKDPSLIPRVREILPDPSALYSAAHERQYRAMLDAHEADAPSTTSDLFASLERIGRLDAAGGTATLRPLASEALGADQALEHARSLAEKARMRRLIETLADLLNDAYRTTDGYEVVLGRARERIDALAVD